MKVMSSEDYSHLPKKRLWITKWQVKRGLLLIILFLPFFASAQIDPVSRSLIQFGYNQPEEGHAPFSGYAYYYRNQPDFLRTNLTLHLAGAPTYLDSNLGF